MKQAPGGGTGTRRGYRHLEGYRHPEEVQALGGGIGTQRQRSCSALSPTRRQNEGGEDHTPSYLPAQVRSPGS